MSGARRRQDVQDFEHLLMQSRVEASPSSPSKDWNAESASAVIQGDKCGYCHLNQ